MQGILEMQNRSSKVPPALSSHLSIPYGKDWHKTEQSLGMVLDPRSQDLIIIRTTLDRLFN